MIQKRTNVLELEPQTEVAAAPILAENVVTPPAAPQIIIAKESPKCTFSAVKLGGTIKRKIVISTISKVLLDAAKQLMPGFSTKQVIESALINSIKLANPKQFDTAKKEIELNEGEIL